MIKYKLILMQDSDSAWKSQIQKSVTALNLLIEMYEYICIWTHRRLI